MFDRTIRHQDSNLKIPIRPVACRATSSLSNQRKVFRVNSLVDQFLGWFGSWFVSKNSIILFRPKKLSAGDLPGKAPDVADSLRYCQIPFAAPQRVFRLLSFLDIRGRAIPFGHLTLYIPERVKPEQKPPVLPILSE